MKPRTRATFARPASTLRSRPDDRSLPGVVYQERLEEINADGQTGLSPELAEFARQIVFGILPLAEKLDGRLRVMRPNGPLTRLRPLTVISCAWLPGNSPSPGRHPSKWRSEPIWKLRQILQSPHAVTTFAEIAAQCSYLMVCTLPSTPLIKRRGVDRSQ